MSTAAGDMSIGARARGGHPLQPPRIALPSPCQNALESNFDRRIDANQFKVLRRAKSIHLRRISDGIDDVMLVVFDLRKDAFSENVRAVFLPEFVANLDQNFACRLLAARAYLVTDDVGERVIVEAFFLEVFGDLALARRVPASKSY